MVPWSDLYGDRISVLPILVVSWSETKKKSNRPAFLGVFFPPAKSFVVVIFYSPYVH